MLLPQFWFISILLSFEVAGSSVSRHVSPSTRVRGFRQRGMASHSATSPRRCLLAVMTRTAWLNMGDAR